MPAQLLVRQTVDRALRKIGAYSVYDTSPDPEEAEEAGYWLDMIVGHLTATRRALWLVPVTLSIPLEADKVSYTEDELRALDPANYPATGLQFPYHATVSDGSRETDVEIIKRLAYDDISDKTTGGKPTHCYIDRRTDFELKVYPVPTVPTQDNTLTYTLKLVGARFRDSVSVENQPSVNGNKTLDLRQGWDLWAVNALAAEIGDGPVRKLPGDEVERMQKRAAQILLDLDKNENEEHDDEFHRVKYVDF